MNAVRVSLIAGALAAMICSSPVEVAAQQQSIMGCVKPGTGLLRIPSPGEGCKKNEMPLSFNDFPNLVALRTQLEQLQAAVTDLQGRVAALEACTSAGVPACNP
jgi:hypothetical protein